MGQVSQVTYSSHFPPAPWAPLQMAYDIGPTDFRYSTSRLSCLLSLRIGDGDTHYFERLIPGTVPLFSTSIAQGRLRDCSMSLLNKLSLIQEPCAEVERPRMRPCFFDCYHDLSKASVRSGASRSATYHGVSGSRGGPLLLNFPQIYKSSAN